MVKTRSEIETQLNTLAEQTPGLVNEHTEDADFWSAFAGASDFILDEAGPDDFEWALLQIDNILTANGRLPAELAPSDDLPLV